jgi:hypothetical protein
MSKGRPFLLGAALMGLAVLTPSCQVGYLPSPCVLDPDEPAEEGPRSAGLTPTDTDRLLAEVPMNEAWVLVDNVTEVNVVIVDDVGHSFGMVPRKRHAILTMPSAGIRRAYAYSTTTVSHYACESRNFVGALEADVQPGCVYLVRVGTVVEQPSDPPRASFPTYRCAGLGFAGRADTQTMSLTQGPPVWASNVSTTGTDLGKSAASCGAQQLARGRSVHNAWLGPALCRRRAP